MPIWARKKAKPSGGIVCACEVVCEIVGAYLWVQCMGYHSVARRLRTLERASLHLGCNTILSNGNRIVGATPPMARNPCLRHVNTVDGCNENQRARVHVRWRRGIKKEAASRGNTHGRQPLSTLKHSGLCKYLFY